MSDKLTDVNQLRDVNRAKILKSIDTAFEHRTKELDLENQKTLQDHKVSLQKYTEEKMAIENSNLPKAEIVSKIKNLNINLGKFEPKPYMAVTHDPHDYPYLLEHAWNKIQNESGVPIRSLSQVQKNIINKTSSGWLQEEYHHAVPIEGLEGVDRCFGVIFMEKNGKYGMAPIMGFGGEISILTYGDVFTAPIKTSPFDKDINRLLK